MKKWIYFIIAILIFLLITGWSVQNTVSAETIKDRIQGTQGTGGLSNLESTIDTSTSLAVSSFRRIGVTVTILFGLYLAWTYLKAGFSPDTLRETKGKLSLFFIFLAFCFFTEQILGFIFSILGIDLSDL